MYSTSLDRDNDNGNALKQ